MLGVAATVGVLALLAVCVVGARGCVRRPDARAGALTLVGVAGPALALLAVAAGAAGAWTGALVAGLAAGGLVTAPLRRRPARRVVLTVTPPAASEPGAAPDAPARRAA